MKIEVGKTYIDAQSDIVRIISKYLVEGIEIFEDNDTGTYTIEGYYKSDTNHNFNLICEVNEDIYTAYKQDLITKKEFLNKHFELYSGMTFEQYNAKNQIN